MKIKTEAYDVYGHLLPIAEYDVQSSFFVDPSPDFPFVLGLWIDKGPSPRGGRIIEPIYLTAEQKQSLSS
jgi:hypothetical protein